MASIGWILAIGGLARLLIGYHIELRGTKRSLDREHRAALWLADWVADGDPDDAANTMAIAYDVVDGQQNEEQSADR